MDVADEGESSKLQKSLSMPTSPTTPLTPSTPTTPGSGRKSDNVWRSVFHPGSNSATKTIGAQMFDKPLPNTPTVYDWYINIYIFLSSLQWILYSRSCILILVIGSTFSSSYQHCMHTNIYCIRYDNKVDSYYYAKRLVMFSPFYLNFPQCFFFSC